jgi:hypothetical protein
MHVVKESIFYITVINYFFILAKKCIHDLLFFILFSSTILAQTVYPGLPLS